jgi:hypothetical protein
MRSGISCEHQIETKAKNLFVCKIGLFGGHPYIGNCIQCISANQNNKDYINELNYRYSKSHPTDKPKASGCCDSAKNYID